MSLSFSCRKHSTLSLEEDEEGEESDKPVLGGTSRTLRTPPGELDLWGAVLCVSVNKLNFFTGILMDLKAKKSCSVRRLLALFRSATWDNTTSQVTYSYHRDAAIPVFQTLYAFITLQNRNQLATNAAVGLHGTFYLAVVYAGCC